MQYCIAFALLHSVIGLKKVAPPSQPIRCKTKTNIIVTWLLDDVFSPILRRLPLFTLSFHWLLLRLSFVLIGRHDNFGFGFMTLR